VTEVLVEVQLVVVVDTTIHYYWEKVKHQYHATVSSVVDVEVVLGLCHVAVQSWCPTFQHVVGVAFRHIVVRVVFHEEEVVVDDQQIEKKMTNERSRYYYLETVNHEVVVVVFAVQTFRMEEVLSVVEEIDVADVLHCHNDRRHGHCISYRCPLTFVEMDEDVDDEMEEDDEDGEDGENGENVAYRFRETAVVHCCSNHCFFFVVALVVHCFL